MLSGLPFANIAHLGWAVRDIDTTIQNFEKSRLNDHAFECRDLCFVLLKKIGRAGILIKGPSLKLLDPNSDQVARDVVAFGETVECLARNEVEGDLSFELDAMDAVLGHGFHPLKARQRRSIRNLLAVHRLGRIPLYVTHHCRMLRTRPPMRVVRGPDQR